MATQRSSLLASRLGVVSNITTPLTLLGNATSLALVVADNFSSVDIEDVRDGGSNISSAAFVTTAASTNTTEATSALPHPVWLTVILGLLAGVVMVVTVLGNITVLLAFGLERTIRQPTNYFLASLAVSDLLIGTFSMPLYTQYLLIGVWPLGPWLCDLWLSLDFSVCLTSQYTVFLITMDRYLSVKIPAKYRNWRTERKVLIMISVTWVLPTVVFFTSIIGWQYFVGERTVPEGQCEVQFMNDAMFIFLLTIGYFWTTLFVIGILYGGIYKVALDLQKKSDAKHKKLQSTMELAGEGPNHHADRGAAPPALEGSNNSSSGGGSAANKQNNKNNKSGAKTNSKKSVRAALPCPAGAAAVNTTSFSTNKQEKDEDRSSSPAFASDDENSSSGGAAGAPKSPLSSGVYIGRPNPAAGIANSALFANTGGLVRSLHGDLFFGGNVDKGESQSLLKAPPSYAQVMSKVGDGSLDGSDVELDSSAGSVRRNQAKDAMYSSTSDRLEKQTMPLLQEEINKGSRYIDEKSFMANLNSENIALLPDLSKDATQAKGGDVNNAQATSSPIWKRRHSLPADIPDEYDVDDEISDFMTGDPVTNFTSVAETSMPGLCPMEVDKNEEEQHLVTGTTQTSDQGSGQQESSARQYDRNNKPSCDVSTVDERNQTELHNNPKGNNVTSSATENDNNASEKPNSNNNASTNANNTTVPSDTNEESSRSDTHCLSAAHRRRNKDTRLHTFVKSVRSRNSRRRNRRERKSKSENRARKALRTITIILGAFVLCWTPYHIAVMVIALCKNCVNDYIYAFTYWMCYLNSPINPFCYAFANAQFKRTFLRIMKFDWHRT